jgi:hypothetical protein
MLEPTFIPKYTEKEIWEEDNVVVKVLEHQVKGSYEELMSKFDKTIILTRQNLKEQIESMSNLLYKKRQNKEAYNTYIYNPSQIVKEEYEFAQNFIIDGNKKLLLINGYHITYEDIYINRSKIEELKEYVGISNDDYAYIIDVNRKYRINSYKNIL